MTQEAVLKIIREILERQGVSVSSISLESNLREIRFRSLDFAELCLRVEEAVGRELRMDASSMRKIVTIHDICRFIESALGRTE